MGTIRLALHDTFGQGGSATGEPGDICLVESQAALVKGKGGLFVALCSAGAA